MTKDISRILYCDVASEALIDTIRELFANEGITCDHAKNIDEAVEQLEEMPYGAVIFHLDSYCSKELRRRYSQKAEWMQVFQHPSFRNDKGDVDTILIPGGGILLVYLDFERYRGVRILMTGVGQNIVKEFLDEGLIDYHVLRGEGARVSKLVELLQEER